MPSSNRSGTETYLGLTNFIEGLNDGTEIIPVFKSNRAEALRSPQALAS